MREFFHGWRRKVGCVTLVMACALFGLWVRSHVIDDKIICTVDGWKYLIHSEHGVLSWFAWDENARLEFVLSAEEAEELGFPPGFSGRIASRYPEWQSQPVSRPPQTVPQVKPEEIAFICGDPLRGFPANGVLTAKHFGFEGVRYVTNSFSNWMITMPLTLLSAYLILWKPRRPSKRLDGPQDA